MAKHEYRIISRRTEGDLSETIESFLNGGWQLVGGVYVEWATDSEHRFYQAITRSWNPLPIGKIITAEKEVMLYSEN